ncbi:MAG: rod shape-determining protein MreD, partial [Chitinispirillales bacterium]|nr:rod shape-determining protein MreD [Chitinispirillales bacterium]
LVQAAIIPKISILGITPDIIVFMLFIFSIKYGQTASIWVGFILGLFVDIYSSEILGVNALAKTIIGGAIGFFDRKNFMVGLIFQLIILAAALIINDIIIYVPNIYQNGENIMEIYEYIFKFSIPRAIYTVFLASVFFVAKDLFLPAKWRT